VIDALLRHYSAGNQDFLAPYSRSSAHDNFARSTTVEVVLSLIENCLWDAETGGPNLPTSTTDPLLGTVELTALDKISSDIQLQATVVLIQRFSYQHIRIRDQYITARPKHIATP